MSYLRILQYCFIGILSLSSAALTTPHQQFPLEDAEKKAFFGQVQAKQKDLKSARLTFLQERYVSTLRETLRSEGVLLFSFPDRLRWETTSPYKSALIHLNGRTQQFEWLKDKWALRDNSSAFFLGEILRKLQDWHRGDFLSSEHLFSIQVFKNNVITLSPKDATLAKGVRTIELSLDKKTSDVTDVKIVEPAGDYTRIHFAKIEKNLNIHANAFDIQSQP